MMSNINRTTNTSINYLREVIFFPPAWCLCGQGCCALGIPHTRVAVTQGNESSEGPPPWSCSTSMGRKGVESGAGSALSREGCEETSWRGELTARRAHGCPQLQHSVQGRLGQALLRVAEQQDKRQQAQVTTWEILKRYQYIFNFFFFHYGRSHALVTQNVCKISILGDSKKKNLTGQGLEQPVLAQLWLDWMTSRCPFLPI